MPHAQRIPCTPVQVQVTPWSLQGSQRLLTPADVHAFAVDPKHQGRGAGAALVLALIDLGNASQLPIYLESSPGTERLYYKMGFRRLPGEMGSIVHRAEVLGTEQDIEVPLMVMIPDPAEGQKEKSRHEKQRKGSWLQAMWSSWVAGEA